MQKHKHINADLKLPLIDLEAGNTATGGKNISTDIIQPERLSEEDNMYNVYWIRTDTHKDVYTEGYVGITRNFKERMRSHKKSKNKYPINNAIQKYGWNNLHKEILHSNCSKKECLKWEFIYRPKQNIGYNCQQGGNLGVESSWFTISVNKDKHSKRTSKGTKKGIQLNDSKEKRSKRAKASRIKNKESYKNVSVGENNSRALLTAKQVREIKCKLIPSGIRNVDIAKQYNVKPHVISFIKTEKNWKHIICDSPAHK